MSEDFSNIINNVKEMVNNGNIPDNIKEILKNYNDNNTKEPNTTSEHYITDSDRTTSSTQNINFDIQTIIKMKSILDSINQQDDPRANLLYSLKPYLRESRRGKLDQYVNLLNISKIADALKKENQENKDE